MEINDQYLQMVMKVYSRKKLPLPEYQIAEMLGMKENSLWYTQLNSWLENPPELGDEKVKAIFLKEVEIFKEAVDNEYSIPANRNAMAYLMIQDFLHILKQLQQNTLHVISQWFYIVGDIILENSKHYKKQMQKELPASAKMRKCLANECDTQVDVSKKKSGTCCIEHSKYYCKECSCWHHYGTKIAEQHFEYKAFNWIKDKQERLQQISLLTVEQK